MNIDATACVNSEVAGKILTYYGITDSVLICRVRLNRADKKSGDFKQILCVK